MIEVVITHLTHPWGPPWTLETLGGSWRPLATLGDMLENDQFPPKSGDGNLVNIENTTETKENQLWLGGC